MVKATNAYPDGIDQLGTFKSMRLMRWEVIPFAVHSPDAAAARRDAVSADALRKHIRDSGPGIMIPADDTGRRTYTWLLELVLNGFA
jgi:hypothetical protein